MIAAILFLIIGLLCGYYWARMFEKSHEMTAFIVLKIISSLDKNDINNLNETVRNLEKQEDIREAILQTLISKIER